MNLLLVGDECAGDPGLALPFRREAEVKVPGLFTADFPSDVDPLVADLIDPDLIGDRLPFRLDDSTLLEVGEAVGESRIDLVGRGVDDLIGRSAKAPYAI